MSVRRILMISSLWPPVVLGGAETYAAALAEQLRARGDEVASLTFGVSGSDVVSQVTPWPYRLEKYASQNAPARAAFHLLDIYRPATNRALREAIERFKPDVIHTHAVSGLSSAALAIPDRRGIGHVHTLHDYWLLCQRSSLVKRDGRACETRCRSCLLVSGLRNRIVSRHPPDVVIAVSNAVAIEHAGLDWMRSKVRVIPNPVVRRQRTHRVDNGASFGFLGRLTREKGVATLVEAFSIASLPDARLLIGGDGPLLDRLRDASAARVEVLGWLDAAAREQFFERIDALVVPSEWKDPAPLVVNEARARGIPVIGARIGGIPELIAPSSQPLLFRPGDRAELADRLTAFAQEPGRYTRAEDTNLLDWEPHLNLVTDAYDVAGQMAQRRT